MSNRKPTSTIRKLFAHSKSNSKASFAFSQAANEAKRALASGEKSSKNSIKKFNNALDTLESFIDEMEKDLESNDTSKNQKTDIRKVVVISQELVRILGEKDKSADSILDAVIAQQKAVEKLSKTIQKEGGEENLKDFLKDLRDNLNDGIVEAFKAQKQKEREKGLRKSAALGRTGLYNTLSDTAFGMFGPLGKDLAKVFGAEEKIEKFFTRAFTKKMGSPSLLPGVGRNNVVQMPNGDRLASAQAAERAALQADSAQDFQRQQQDFQRQQIDAELRIARATEAQAEGKGEIFKTLLEIFMPGGWVGKMLGWLPKIAAGLTAALGLTSFFGSDEAGLDVGDLIPSGGGGSGGGGGGPAKTGRLGKLGKFLGKGKSLAKRFGGKALQLGTRFGGTAGRLAMSGGSALARGGLALLANPVVDIVGAGYLGYQAGQALDNATGGKLSLGASDIMTSAADSAKSLWDKATNFMSGGQNISDILKTAAQRTGVDYGTLMAFCKQESGFNPNAKASTSSAKGLFQFTNKTWADMVNKYGNTLGIGINDVMDPLSNATMGAMYIKENTSALKRAGIPVNGTTLYAAHFLGAGGAVQLFGANPNTDASALMPSAAKANPGIFKNKDGTSKTVAEVQQTLFDKVGKNVDAASAAGKQMVAGTSGAADSTARAKAGDNLPASAPTAPVSGTSVASSNSSSGLTPQYNMDSIPMYVDDMGLVITTLGNVAG